MLNLIDSGFQDSSIFRHMPRFAEITYSGFSEGKVRQYRALREDQPCDFLALNFIRNDEILLWDAVEDFVKRSTIDATSSVRGVYIFDLLAIDIYREIKSFKHSELTGVIINEAGRLSPGKAALLKYSSVYALIHKKIDEDWGKINFKTAVDVFKDKAEYLDLLIKQLLKDYTFSRVPVILLLNDLSLNPIFDPQNQTQQARIKKVMDELIPNSVEFVPEVYIQDKHGTRELLSGSQL
ncbi:MAG: hypothetical protein WC695_00510 [Candidatus Omnitrophota bacterium]